MKILNGLDHPSRAAPLANDFQIVLGASEQHKFVTGQDDNARDSGVM
jgi:hypothetical protein